MAGTLTSPIDFYNILVRIIRAWPETVTDGVNLHYRRINTFAAITAKADQNAYNLDKDSRYKDRPYFYSRRWELNGFKDSELNFDYPALVCIENQDDIKSLFQPSKKHTVQLAFFLTDLMPQKESDVTRAGEQRTFEQIGSDMRKLLDELMTELGQFVWSRYDDGGGFSAWGWYSQRWMTSQGYTIEKQNALKTKIRERELISTPRYGFWGDNLAEMPFYLTIEVQPCFDAVAFDYEYDTYRKLPDTPHSQI